MESFMKNGVEIWEHMETSQERCMIKNIVLSTFLLNILPLFLILFVLLLFKFNTNIKII